MRNKESKQLKQLSDNFIALLLLQLLNYLLPLLLIPYLIRVLGVEGFGVYSFILAITLYGVQMSDYGFELSATYHISLNRDNPKKIDEIFSSVLTIKLIIASLYLIFIILLIPLFDKFMLYHQLIILSFGILLGQVLFPVWFFQGIEKMRYILYLNGFLKLIFILSIFLMVKEKSDLHLLLILNSIITLSVGITALYIAIKKFKVQLTVQPLSRLYYYLKEGWYLFISKFAVEFYTTINIIILGLFASPLIVGYYAISVKIIQALGSLLDPITRTLYPYLIRVYQNSNEDFISKNRKLSIVIFLIMMPLSVLVYSSSAFILETITGVEAMPLNIHILQIFSFTLIVYLYGSQFTNMLVTIKKTKFLNQILFLTAGLNTLLAPPLLYFYGVIGMVWLSLFLAFFLTSIKGYYIFFYHQNKGQRIIYA